MTGPHSPHHRSLPLGILIFSISSTAHAQTLTKESFLETIRAARPAIQECYESRRAANPALKGFVVVPLTIDKDGTVIEAVAERNGTGDESLGKCVAAQVEGLSFAPPANGKPTKAMFQFTFTPGRYFPIPPESLGPELPAAPAPRVAEASEAFSLGGGADGEENDVAVMPLVGNRVPEATVAILNELLIAEVDDLTDYKVIGTSDINAMLGLEKMKEAVGCDDVACAAEIGGALGVRFLLAGSVSSLGGEIIVNLKLIDIAAQSVKNRGRETTPGDEMFFRYAVRNALLDLLGKGKDPLPARPAPLPPDAAPVVGASSPVGTDPTAPVPRKTLSKTEFFRAGGDNEFYELYARSGFDYPEWDTLDGCFSLVGHGNALLVTGAVLALGGALSAIMGAAFMTNDIWALNYIVPGAAIGGLGLILAVVGLPIRVSGISGLADVPADTDPKQKVAERLRDEVSGYGVLRGAIVSTVFMVIGLTGGIAMTVTNPTKDYEGTTAGFGIGLAAAAAGIVLGVVSAPDLSDGDPRQNDSPTTALTLQPAFACSTPLQMGFGCPGAVLQGRF